MGGHEVVDSVPDHGRDDQAQGQKGPRKAQPSKNPQNCPRPLMDPSILQQENCVNAGRDPRLVLHDALEARALNRCESKLMPWVPIDHEIHEAIAEMANAIEENDCSVGTALLHVIDLIIQESR